MWMIGNRSHAAVVVVTTLICWLSGCDGRPADNEVDGQLYSGEDSVYVVIYISAASCGFSSSPEMVDGASQIPSLFSAIYDMPSKFVLVVMDSNLDVGLRFSRRHGHGWDEVSVGGRYNNETLLSFVNSETISGTPHVLVYKDYYDFDDLNIPHRKSRTLVANFLGRDAIMRWIDDNVALPL